MKNLFPNESIFSEIIELVYEKNMLKTLFIKNKKMMKKNLELIY